MKKKIIDILKYAAAFAAAAALLYFSFRGIAWEDFAAALLGCRLEWVAVSMTAGLSILFVRGLRWKMLLEPIDPSTRVRTTFNAINICMGVNLALPRVGELVRIGFITRRSARGEDGKPLASYDKVLGSVVGERVWDVASVAILSLVIIPLMWGKAGAFFRDSIFSGNSRLGGLWVLVLALGALAGTLLLVRRCRSNRICGKIWGFCAGIWNGLKESLKLRRGGLFVVYTVLIWLLYWITSWTILLALQGMDPAGLSPEMAETVARIQTMNGWDALFLMLAGALSSIIPVPGGFGAFHSIVALALLTVYGVPFSFGLIFATLSHESEALIYLGTSLLSFLDETIRRPADPPLREDCPKAE
ncbi:MAG: flippase-like domain-containing protein [Bacteroidales bacterium]|nr:flippase-like domain-containing protein [Bacteroidales bacterium]